MSTYWGMTSRDKIYYEVSVDTKDPRYTTLRITHPVQQPVSLHLETEYLPRVIKMLQSAYNLSESSDE